jgi:putative CocE/NonD family hydrolase
MPSSAFSPSTARVPVDGDPSGGANAKRWRADFESPRYPRIAVEETVLIPMSDGVELYATVLRPADSTGKPIAARFPVVLNFVGYGRQIFTLLGLMTAKPKVIGAIEDLARAAERGSSAGIAGLAQSVRSGAVQAGVVSPNLIRDGYVCVLVDIRGTGASPGIWDVIGDREQQDYVEVAEWARTAPWSDGNLAATGVSYGAIAAQHLAARNPEGLKAIFALEGSADPSSGRPQPAAC